MAGRGASHRGVFVFWVVTVTTREEGEENDDEGEEELFEIKKNLEEGNNGWSV